MNNVKPKDYLKTLVHVIDQEIEKITVYKSHFIEQNQYEVASQYRDIEKSLLDVQKQLQKQFH